MLSTKKKLTLKTVEKKKIFCVLASSVNKAKTYVKFKKKKKNRQKKIVIASHDI